jgi:Holliday junction DNA helicase RuvA
VGYEVQVPLSLHGRWQGQLAPTAISLHIHHVQREDSAQLYGFEERRERDLFRLLISVNGVGPQVGLALLSALGFEELVEAILQADLARLSSAQGVGKRTAERLSVELRSKLGDRFGPTSPTAQLLVLNGGAPAPLGLKQELELTLSALGYGPLEIGEAQRAAALAGCLAEDGLDDWLRECLSWLGRQIA